MIKTEYDKCAIKKKLRKFRNLKFLFSNKSRMHAAKESRIKFREEKKN